MTSDDLLKLVTNAEGTINTLVQVRKSDGAQHWVEFWKNFKTDSQMQDAFCKLFGILPTNLPSMIAAVDNALVMVDNGVAQSPQYLDFLTKFSGHPFMVKMVAQLLG